MQKHIEELIKLVEEERKEEINKMMWEIKNLSGEQRERKGRAILNLTPRAIGEELGMYLIKFGRKKVIETEIGIGDEVIISKGNPLKSDFHGVVIEKGSRYIVVSVDKLLPRDFKNIRIDLYASDVTYKRQIDNLKNLSESGKKVLKYLLEDEILKEEGEEQFKPSGVKLNKSQIKAVSKSLSSTTFFLIHGPFGTGKTTTLSEYILQEIRKGKKILVTADSNMAVDNLIEKLGNQVLHVRIGHPSRVSSHLIESTLAYKIENHEKSNILKSLKEEFKKLIDEREKFQKPIPKWKRGLSEEQILKLAKENKSTRGIPSKIIKDMANWIILNRKISDLKEKMRELEIEIAKNIIENSNVVFSTNSSAFSEILDGFIFDVVVVDEATQATIPSVLIPLSKAKKFVLAGDHKQLPPTVLSEKAKKLSITLFERLIEKYPHKSEILNIQYRMNKRLMEFPNREFYNGKLISASSNSNITLKDFGIVGKDKITDSDNVLVFVDTMRKENKFESKKKDSTSYFNKLEAEIVRDLVDSFLNLGVKNKWIGVITPYDDQVDLIRSFELNIEVNTVDGFQGREKEIIIISFVRSNEKGELGFLTDLRRLNVSLTRAKRKLICVGDSLTLKEHPVYRRFIEHVKNNETYIIL